MYILQEVTPQDVGLLAITAFILRPQNIKNFTSWRLVHQPIRKICAVVKMDHLPQVGMKIKKWNHHLDSSLTIWPDPPSNDIFFCNKFSLRQYHKWRFEEGNLIPRIPSGKLTWLAMLVCRSAYWNASNVWKIVGENSPGVPVTVKDPNKKDTGVFLAPDQCWTTRHKMMGLLGGGVPRGGGSLIFPKVPKSALGILRNPTIKESKSQLPKLQLTTLTKDYNNALLMRLMNFFGRT